LKAALAAFLLTIALSCTSLRVIDAGEFGDLDVQVELDDQERLGAKITLTNRGSSRVAIANYYGVRTRWIRLEVVDEKSGTPFRWPDIHLYRPPPYDCLKPGESVSIGVSLLSWQPQFRGQDTDPETTSFEYPPGAYRMQASYKDWAKSGKRKAPWRCPAIVGEVKSDWVEFEVPEE